MTNSDHCAQAFSAKMSQGKTKAALSLLSNQQSGKPMCLDDIADHGTGHTVLEVLEKKHPPAQPAVPEAVVNGQPQEVHSVFFLWYLCSVHQGCCIAH